MTNNEKLFRQKVEKLAEVYVAKNKDYGDSFTRSLDKYDILASLIRMGDKMNRIESLYDKPTSEVDESLVDSLEDLANYAIMTAIWLENKVEDECDQTTLFTSDDHTESIDNDTHDWEYVEYDDNDIHDWEYIWHDDNDNVYDDI